MADCERNVSVFALASSEAFDEITEAPDLMAQPSAIDPSGPKSGRGQGASMIGTAPQHWSRTCGINPMGISSSG